MPTLWTSSVLLTEDEVRILDRRVFPFEHIYVDCHSVEEVARAIEEMVTQSGGPFYAASAGMVLAARCADPDAPLPGLRAAAARLIATRPTNNQVAHGVREMLAQAEALAGRPDFAQAMEAEMRALWERHRNHSRQLGENAASLVADGEAILTHCWAEATIIQTMAAILRSGKRVSVLCTETRPYLQGSRLTAHSLAEMGVDVTVITDSMAAWAMAQGRASRLMTAADRVTMSGHIINKIGTLQLAIAAQAYAIPYIAMVKAPDRDAPDPSAVPVEDRDPDESLHCLGLRTATPLARGWYPAFDVTPPHLVSAVVTSRGVFPSCALSRHYETPS